MKQSLSGSERIRNISVYLRLLNSLYSFCWMRFAKDGSLSFGFTSRTPKLDQYGSAVLRSGVFVNHAKTLARGTVDIKDTEGLHVTFHPPRIRQKSGVAHLVDSDGRRVDTWEFDWFPVKKLQLLLVAYTGNINMLETIAEFKGRYEVVNVPLDSNCLRMELVLFPIPTKSQIRIDDSNAAANIIGGCPHYLVRCAFYNNPLQELGFYIPSDRCSK